MWHGVHRRIVGVAVLAALIGGSIAVWSVERNGDGPIDSYADSVWWAITTVTTVGYGDIFPVTPEGRGIAAFLMLAGIATFGIVSAGLAALFIRRPEQNESDKMLRRIDDLTALVESLHSKIDGLGDETSEETI